MQERKKKVVVGLSGGVDSAVSAALLFEQGYDVIGLFMRNWDSFVNNDLTVEESDICPQEQDYQEAQKVAKHLNIPLFRVDFIKEYWDYVFKYFLEELKANRTPNPDLFCNKYIKFDCFRKYAFQQFNCDFIATGHYARVEHHKNNILLLKGKDENKDQSYFLAQLQTQQLEKVLFPIGDLCKSQVRKKAAILNLPNALKKDSTGICFIGERNFKTFLQNYLPAKSGNIIDIVTNQIIGQHHGVYYYTIGQRKGINLSGMKKPYFVVKKDAKQNILFVASENENHYLMSTFCLVEQINWLVIPQEQEFICKAKFRYRQRDEVISIKILNQDQIKVTFSQPLRAITPGQAAVFYKEDIVLGSGIIQSQ